MDQKINLMKLTIEKNKEEYKNLISVWENYFDIKIKNLHNQLEQFNKLFNTENKPESDLDLETILLLYMLSNS